jgi:hypothetical protein
VGLLDANSFWTLGVGSNKKCAYDERAFAEIFQPWKYFEIVKVQGLVGASVFVSFSWLICHFGAVFRRFASLTLYRRTLILCLAKAAMKCGDFGV